MGWLCRRCNTENEFSDQDCRACGARAAALYLVSERLAAACERKLGHRRLGQRRQSVPSRPSCWVRLRLDRSIKVINGVAVTLALCVTLASIYPNQLQVWAFVSSRLTQQYAAERWEQIQNQLGASTDLSEVTLLLLQKTNTLADRERAARQRIALRVGGFAESVGSAGDRTALTVAGYAERGQQRLADIASRTERFDAESWLKHMIRWMIGLFDDIG